MVTKRILRELKDIENDPLTFCSVGHVDGDLHQWQAAIMGSHEGPYAGGVFVVSILFPREYPFKPPEVEFKTKIFHPNINKDGYIYLPMVREDWNPGFTVSMALSTIYSILAHPNPDDPLDCDCANMYKTNRAKFDATTRSWTQEYAMN